MYVYNIAEDLNTRVVESMDTLCEGKAIESCAQPFRWMPDSRHLLFINDKKVNLVEDDGSNMTTIYAGPFTDQYVFPWSDGSKVVILTNLNNTSVAPTLYTIGLK